MHYVNEDPDLARLLRDQARVLERSDASPTALGRALIQYLESRATGHSP